MSTFKPALSRTGHCRPYTKFPRIIRSSRDDTESNLGAEFSDIQEWRVHAYNGERFPFEFRIMLELDIRVKSIHINMHDCLAEVSLRLHLSKLKRLLLGIQMSVR